MPRFVILTHDHPKLHWDLMVEWEGTLRTWRLLQEPCLGDIPAEQLADHRLAYLDYEGPVSRNRGDVRRHDSGTCIVGDLSGSLIQIRFQGKHLIGDCELAQVESSRDQWRLRLA